MALITTIRSQVGDLDENCWYLEFDNKDSSQLGMPLPKAWCVSIKIVWAMPSLLAKIELTIPEERESALKLRRI